MIQGNEIHQITENSETEKSQESEESQETDESESESEVSDSSCDDSDSVASYIGNIAGSDDNFEIDVGDVVGGEVFERIVEDLEIEKEKIFTDFESAKLVI